MPYALWNLQIPSIVSCKTFSAVLLQVFGKRFFLFSMRFLAATKAVDPSIGQRRGRWYQGCDIRTKYLQYLNKTLIHSYSFYQEQFRISRLECYPFFETSLTFDSFFSIPRPVQAQVKKRGEGTPPQANTFAKTPF